MSFAETASAATSRATTTTGTKNNWELRIENWLPPITASALILNFQFSIKKGPRGPFF